MFYHDSVNNQAHQSSQKAVFLCFFDEEKEAVYGRNKNNDYGRSEK